MHEAGIQARRQSSRRLLRHYAAPPLPSGATLCCPCRRVDLNKINFDDPQLKTLPLGGTKWNKATTLLQVGPACPPAVGGRQPRQACAGLGLFAPARQAPARKARR